MKKLTYSVKDVMYATGLGKNTIYKAIKSGALQSKTYGSRRLITAAALNEWIEQLPTNNKGN